MDWAIRSVFLSLLILARPVSAQTAASPPDPAAVFQRARTRLLADAGRMPRYTCEQNIVRHFYRADSTDPQSCATILAMRDKRKHDLHPDSWDRLQLDVAVADDREIHSWPGAPRFNEEEIRKLVSNGPFGSGDFRNFITGIFGGSATIRGGNEHLVNGRILLQYAFTVTQSASHYEIVVPPVDLTTAYSGSFLLDPQTADLVQLDVHTAELPEASSACQAISEIQYGRMNVHGRDVLIPKETDLRIVYRNGREAMAATSYSSCHEYTSKSVLRFDNAERVAATPSPPPAEPAEPVPPAKPFPAGLHFHCRILTPIDSDTPAGRPIEAVLRSPLSDKHKTVLVPSGARIRGRLVRLADHKSTMDYFEVGVRLESIEVNGAAVPLYATLANQAPPPARLGSQDLWQALADFPPAPPRNVGIFFFVQEQIHLKQIDASWITTSPETDDEPHTTAPSKTQQQILAIDAGRAYALALKYSQQAADLLAARPPTGNLADDPRLADIVEFRREAIEAGKSADPDALNDLHPGLGDEFKDKFLVSLSLFVHGCGIWAQSPNTAREELSRSTLLLDEWSEWYRTHRAEIEDVMTAPEPQTDRSQTPPAPGTPGSIH